MRFQLPGYKERNPDGSNGKVSDDVPLHYFGVRRRLVNSLLRSDRSMRSNKSIFEISTNKNFRISRICLSGGLIVLFSF